MAYENLECEFPQAPGRTCGAAATYLVMTQIAPYVQMHICYLHLPEAINRLLGTQQCPVLVRRVHDWTWSGMMPKPTPEPLNPDAPRPSWLESRPKFDPLAWARRMRRAAPGLIRAGQDKEDCTPQLGLHVDQMVCAKDDSDIAVKQAERFIDAFIALVESFGWVTGGAIYQVDVNECGEKE